MKLQYNKGFTLIELMVVVSIVGMLSSVILVALQGARDKGKVGAGVTFATHTYRAFGADAYAMWNFDNSASDGLDDSGNANNLIFSGTPTFASGSNTYSGQGRTLVLNGTSQYGISTNQVSLNTSIGGSVNFTLGAWIKTTNSSNVQPIIVFGGEATGSNALFGFCISQSGRLDYYQTSFGSNYWCSSSTGTAIADGKWHYVAMSYKYSGTGTGRMQLYVDGKIDRSISVDFYNTAIHRGNINVGIRSGPANWGIGAGPTHLFSGSIDDANVYSQFLAAEEIQQIYIAGLPTHSVASR